MKWGTMLLFLYIFQLAFILFYGVYNENTTQQQLISMYTNSSDTNSSSSVTWAYFLNPTGMNDTTFFATLFSIMGVTTFIGIGFYFIFKSDLTILFGFFTLIIGLGAIPIINMWNVVTKETTLYGCVAGANCFPATIAGIIIVGLLGFVYVLACLEWWTNRPTT